jgi:hypothetical protein
MGGLKLELAPLNYTSMFEVFQYVSPQETLNSF